MRVVAHCPLHGPSANKRPQATRNAIRRLNALSVGTTEAYGLRGKIAPSGYRFVQEHGGKDRRRGQYDNPMLVKKHVRSLGSGQFMGAEASTPHKIAPERWWTWQAMEFRNDVLCHITGHPHAAIQNKVTGALRKGDRAEQALEQFRAMEAFIEFCLQMDWKPILTADMNFRDRKHAGPGPYKILRDLDMDVKTFGIDGAAWHRSLDLRVYRVRRPRSISNHPWFVGAL